MASSDEQTRLRAARSGWAAWLALKMVPGVGNVLGLGLVRAFRSPEAVFAARDQELQCAGVRREVRAALRRFEGWRDVEAQTGAPRRLGGRLVTWDDASYPELLRQIHDPPLFLYVLGELTAAGRFRGGGGRARAMPVRTAAR